MTRPALFARPTLTRPTILTGPAILTRPAILARPARGACWHTAYNVIGVFSRKIVIIIPFFYFGTVPFWSSVIIIIIHCIFLLCYFNDLQVPGNFPICLYRGYRSNSADMLANTFQGHCPGRWAGSLSRHSGIRSRCIC